MTEQPTPDAPGRGSIIDLEIGEVAHGGIFVAHDASGRVVFVPDALPGERVRVRITEAKRRFARAETLEVLEASPERQPHIWAEAGIDRDPAQRVGGAEFGHAKLPFQRELKRRVVTDALRRFGDTEWAGEVEALPGDDASAGTGWRTRVSLHVDAAGRVGPFAARSHRIVEVAALPLAFADIDELARSVLHAKVAPGPDRLDFVAPADSDTRMRRASEHPAHGTVRERVGERDFVVAENGFWQVHRFAATALSEAVREAVDQQRFDPSAANLDLYGGVGLFAAVLGELGGEGTALETVEAATRATELAAENLAEWRNARATTARVDRYLAKLTASAGAPERAALRAGTVVLDPPRAGAGAEVVQQLAALEPAQLIYVACDPVALSRDLRSFAEAGYRAEHIRALDLFPNTHHVEAVVRLGRAD